MEPMYWAPLTLQTGSSAGWTWARIKNMLSCLYIYAHMGVERASLPSVRLSIPSSREHSVIAYGLNFFLTATSLKNQRDLGPICRSHVDIDKIRYRMNYTMAPLFIEGWYSGFTSFN